MKRKTLLTAVLLAASWMAVGPAAARTQEKLTERWATGHYKDKDDALYGVIKKSEAKHPNVKVVAGIRPFPEFIVGSGIFNQAPGTGVSRGLAQAQSPKPGRRRWRSDAPGWDIPAH